MTAAAAAGTPGCATSRVLHRLQGGTGRHVDGDVNEPLASRPFQALVQLSDSSPTATGAHADGSLKVLPGFHAAASRFFGAADLPPPSGGFTPLTADSHADLCAHELWLPVRRVPASGTPLHAAGKLPPPSAAATARARGAIVKGLRKLSAELKELGEAAPARRGDYVMWDPRLPHSTGEPAALNGGGATRQVFYCAFMLARDNGALAAEQRACRDSGLHPSWAPNTHRHDEARSDYVAAPLGELGDALYGTGARRGRPTRIGTLSPRARAAARRRRRAVGGGGGRRRQRVRAERGARGLLRAVWLRRSSERWARRWSLGSPPRSVSTSRDAHGVEPSTGGGDARRRREWRRRERRRRRAWRRRRRAADDASAAAGVQPGRSGMLELYWLPAMEAARQAPALLRITQRLYAAARLGANRRRAHNLWHRLYSPRGATHRLRHRPFRYARDAGARRPAGLQAGRAHDARNSPPRPSRLLQTAARCGCMWRSCSRCRFVPLRRLRALRRQRRARNAIRPSTRGRSAPPPPPPPRTPPPPTATTRTLATRLAGRPHQGPARRRRRGAVFDPVGGVSG